MENEFNIDAISKLARMNLSGEESESLREDLRNILSYVNMLSELDLEDIEPTSHVVEIENVFRDDVVRESHTADKLFGLISDEKYEGYFFKVPKIIEE